MEKVKIHGEPVSDRSWTRLCEAGLATCRARGRVSVDALVLSRSFTENSMRCPGGKKPLMNPLLRLSVSAHSFVDSLDVVDLKLAT